MLVKPYRHITDTVNSFGKMSNLVLSRRKKESIVIHIPELGEVICTFTITNLGPKQVKLAFDAESYVKIDRKEIFDKQE